VFLVAGCTTTPAGPTVLVLPGTGEPFDQFQADAAACRSWALEQVGGATPAGVVAGRAAASSPGLAPTAPPGRRATEPHAVREGGQ
jgi:hypothetical protein